MRDEKRVRAKGIPSDNNNPLLRSYNKIRTFNAAKPSLADPSKSGIPSTYLHRLIIMTPAEGQKRERDGPNAFAIFLMVNKSGEFLATELVAAISVP